MAQKIITAADNAVRAAALKLIAAYRLFLSPFFGNGCRFTPSCSEYAAQAFSEHAAPFAFWLVLRRLARCHPFCAGGEDPPPPGKNARPPESGRTKRG
ncbi:MAG: membrane protein insertion efficiency factor YidD [Gammaproteobacteria bacterium]